MKTRVAIARRVSRRTSESPCSTRSSTSMPSDPRVELASSAMAPYATAYRAAITAVIERARGYLAQGGGSTRLAAELGPFGATHIDADALASITSRGAGLDNAARVRIEGAVWVLRSL